MGISGFTPGAGGSDRQNNFDALRFFLATSVVFAHSFIVLGGGHTRIGLAAVAGFFGISGFLVTQSWLGPTSLLSFFRNRALRIYPGFATVCLFDYFVVGPLATPSMARYFARIDPVRIVTQILLLDHRSIPGVFKDHPLKQVNVSLWTIPYEFTCYILMAILGAWGVIGRRRRLLALAAVAWSLYIAVPALMPLVSPGPWPRLRSVDVTLRFVSCFLLGAAFCLYREKVVLNPALAATAVILLAVSALRPWMFRFAWPICFLYVLLYIAYHPAIRLQSWGKRGDYSYGIYIYAFPVQQLLVEYAGEALNPYTLFLAAMAMTLPLAAGSWHFIERPCLRMKAGRKVFPRLSLARRTGALVPAAIRRDGAGRRSGPAPGLDEPSA